MKCTYTIEREDVHNYLNFFNRRLRMAAKPLLSFKAKIALWLLIVFSVVAVRSYDLIDIHIPTAVLFSLITLVTFCLIYKRLTKQTFNLCGEHLLATWTIHLEEEGVRHESEYIRSHTAWSFFQEVVETDENIYLLFSFAEGYFVPKHAFDSQADVVAFLDSVKARIGSGAVAQH